MRVGFLGREKGIGKDIIDFKGSGEGESGKIGWKIGIDYWSKEVDFGFMGMAVGRSWEFWVLIIVY